MRKSIFIVTTIVAPTLSLSLASGISKAQAGTLIPQKEGEIKLTNLACLDTINPECIDTSGGTKGYKVTSLIYDQQFSESRLLVDKRATANNYSAFGIKFLATDEGTNPQILDEYWLRPVAYAPVTTTSKPSTSTNTQTNVAAPAGAQVGTQTITEPSTQVTTTNSKGVKTTTTTSVEKTIVTKLVSGKLKQTITTKTTTQKTTVTPKPVENGRLEVGKFQFDFKNPLAGLQFNFFDVEDSKYTGILSYTNTKGEIISINQLLTGGQNGNIQSLIIKDVKSFVVQLGNPGQKYGYKDSQFEKTGDGVNLQLETVPEPGTTASLGLLAIAGVFGLRQRKKASHLA